MMGLLLLHIQTVMNDGISADEDAVWTLSQLLHLVIHVCCACVKELTEYKLVDVIINDDFINVMSLELFSSSILRFKYLKDANTAYLSHSSHKSVFSHKFFFLSCTFYM